jgi:hypothetical protein
MKRCCCSVLMKWLLLLLFQHYCCCCILLTWSQEAAAAAAAALWRTCCHSAAAAAAATSHAQAVPSAVTLLQPRVQQPHAAQHKLADAQHAHLLLLVLLPQQHPWLMWQRPQHRQRCC